MANSSKKDLNPQQLEAVNHAGWPLLIIAGAGTGKTTVITERIKRIITEGLAKPEEILALTFTEKAAREMEERVDVALPYGTFGLWISTFHSFADRILKYEALHIGLNPSFKLMSDAETFQFIKKNFWKFDLKYFRPSGNPYKFIEGLISHFDRLKDEDVSVDDYLKFAEQKQKFAENGSANFGNSSENFNLDEEAKKYQELANAYKQYEQLKTAEGVMDFSDLIGNTLKLFRQRKSILAQYQKQFKFILVDEFQDTNFAQYELIKLLVPPEHNSNLTVVGDDSQSIYKFRGAAISNILSFMKDYPMAKQVVLTLSYRCDQTVLDAAYRLIKHNDPYTLEAQLKIDKNLKSLEGRKSEPIELIKVDRVEEEAEAVVTSIKNQASRIRGRKYSDFAILVRANNHSEPFIRALERARIPFQFLGPGQLFRKSEIKDLIAYLKVLADFTDSQSLFRVLTMDIWSISPRDLIAILNQGKKTNSSLFETLEQISQIGQTGLIDNATKEKVTRIVDMIHRHQKLVPKETAGQLLYYFLEDSSLLKKIVDFKTQIEEHQALNMTKFFDRLKTYEATHQDASVFAVVDYLDLAMAMAESPLAAEIDWSANDAVNILTVHSAKGLEFPVVFLVNLIEGRFPSRERREQIPIPDELIREKETLPEGDFHLQEERRLFYVGITRAEKKLIYSVANFYGEGKRERKMSPFIGESLGENWEEAVLAGKKEKQLPLFEWSRPKEESAINDERPAMNYKVDFLSYSAIDTFRLCHLHYKLRSILKIPTPMTAAQAMGNSIHLALKDFYQGLNNSGTKGDRGTEKDFLFKLLDANWIKQGYESKKHEEETKEKAQRFLEAYLNDGLHQNCNAILLEKSFNFWIHSTGSGQVPSEKFPLKILGKIDRVDDLGDGKIEIIDYKTGANVPSQRDIDADLQMTIYALAATDKGILNKNTDQISLSFYYFDTATKISTTRSPEQLELAKQDLLRIRDEIEASGFACSRNIFCENCEYKMLCGA